MGKPPTTGDPMIRSVFDGRIKNLTFKDPEKDSFRKHCGEKGENAGILFNQKKFKDLQMTIIFC